MNNKRKVKKGFTLIELLVVIAIIALLLAIITPALRMAKEQARKVVCKSNLSQLAKAIEMYEMDNDYKRFSARNDGTPEETSLYWMGKLADYAGNEAYGEEYRQGEKIDLLLCPSAPYNKFEVNTALQVASGQIGTAANPWEWDRSDVGIDMSTIGSYTINGGVAYDWMYESPDSSNYDPSKAQRAYSNWMRTPTNVPVFACGRWTIGWPTSAWPATWGGTGAIPTWVLDGEQMIVDGDDMDRFCINRHSNQINVVFKDLHVETKKVEELWNLRWNKEWAFPNFPIRIVNE
jgi:prepilin-type N-terminal cleavage/methylation domain-containing protein